MKIKPGDYAIHNRMEDVAKQAVALVLEEHDAGCSCRMCREDMQSLLLNQLPRRYVSVVPSIPLEPLRMEELEAETAAKVMWEARRAVSLVRKSPRHEHDRSPMQNCTESMARSALGEVLAQEQLEVSREQLGWIMAEILNELPPHYTTSFQGDAFARTAELDWGSLAKTYSIIYNVLKRLALIPAHS